MSQPRARFANVGPRALGFVYRECKADQILKQLSSRGQPVRTSRAARNCRMQCADETSETFRARIVG